MKLEFGVNRRTERLGWRKKAQPSAMRLTITKHQLGPSPALRCVPIFSYLTLLQTLCTCAAFRR
jgi:hypothetical protein